MKNHLIQNQWNYAAGSWIEFVRNGKDYYREYKNAPALKKMIGDVRGKQVLDMACGEGYFSRYYAKSEANVTGIDFSEEMIKAAIEEEVRKPLGIEYYIADASDLRFLDSESFDIVFSFMALMDITDYESAIREASRVLRPCGRFVFQIPHPCFEFDRSIDGKQVCVWETKLNPDGKKEYLYLRIVDYFERHDDLVEWEQDSRRPYAFTTSSFHRTLSDYVSALFEHGLVITRLDEPKPSDTGCLIDPSLGKHVRVPHSLVIESLKQ
jgi:ubiquinone/menaquinone biosynthesis C-methylase UbiE